MTNKIAVIGAGAIGSVIGALLFEAGEDVTLISRKSHVDEIKNNGLSIDGLNGKRNLNINAREKLDFTPDIIIITVKSQNMEETCKQISKYAQDIPVVTMQNGIRCDEIAGRFFDYKNIISCIAVFNALFLKPGYVTYVTPAKLIIGMPFDNDKIKLDKLQKIFQKISDVTVNPNITGARWTKLLMNLVGNSLSALTGLTAFGYSESRKSLKLGILMLREAYQVINKSGIKLESIPGMDIKQLGFLLKLPIIISIILLKNNLINSEFKNTISSTLQSIKRGKKTEVDYLNGEIVKLGEKLNIKTPFNSRAVKIIHEIEVNNNFITLRDIKNIFFK